MINIFILIAVCLLVFTQCGILFLVYRMIMAINRHNSEIKPEVSFQNGGIDLTFFNKPRHRRPLSFTKKADQWIQNHNNRPIGGEIIGK